MTLGTAMNNYKAMVEAKVSGKHLFDVIDRQPKIQLDDPKAEKHVLDGSLEFKNVDFYYPTRPDQKVLDNFSAKFEKGKTTAIVGPSGSGKSTIIQLIERFYDSNEGQVLVDGKDVKSINLRDYRRQIGYVPQEPVLMNEDVRYNIKLGCPNATDDQVIEALKKTNAWEFISTREEGIFSKVGAGGSAFSGGEKQRLALARAFIKMPKVLILDEATSALDKKNERDVQNAIEDMKKELGGVTTVVIAHRLSTIRNADKILVMVKGKLVEEGNHDELLSQHPNGVYAGLVKT